VARSWDSGNHRVGRGSRVRAVPRSTLLLGIAGLLLLGGCGGGEGGEPFADAESPSTTEDRRRDEPLATEPEAVTPYIANLLAEHDYVVNQILVEPAVARERDDRLVRRYLGLYEPESGVPDQALDTWAEMSSAGERFEPYEPGQPINTTTVVGEVEALEEDQVAFQTCHEQHYRIHDADENVIDEQPDVERPGEGIAVHVDGRWRLQRVDIASGPRPCAGPGRS
jgi:hypothetical protein